MEMRVAATNTAATSRVLSGRPVRSLLFPRLPSQDALTAGDDGAEPPFTSAAECRAPSAAELDSSEDRGVTLVTQASSDRLWMIPHICSRWGDAPMIAVTLTGQTGRPEWPHFDESLPCYLARLELSSSAAGSETAEAYPINWLRNQGIACVRTSHYFVVDVDFWPSTELLPAILRQLSTWRGALKALVVPNFQRSGHGCRNEENPKACRAAFERGSIHMPTNFSALGACLTSKE